MNFTPKDEALEDYFDTLSRVPPPVNNTCYALAKYSSDILEGLRKLYDAAYSHGFNDAANLKINIHEKK